MEIKEYLEVVFGALLGFALTMVTQLIDLMKKRKRSNNLLTIEYRGISRFLDSVVKANQNGHKIILRTEVPNFKMVYQVEELLNLNTTRRTLVYDLVTSLNNAENLRQLAVPILNDKNKENELELYGDLYNGYLIKASEALDKLKVELS